MKGMLRRADRLLCSFEDTAVVVLLIVAVTLYFSQVVSRYLIGFTFPWAEETIVAMVVWSCFIGASIAIRHKAHIRVDLVVRFLPDPLQRPVAAAAIVLSLVFTFLIFWWGVEFVQFMAATRNRAESMDMPAYPLYLAVPLGGGLMSIRFLQELWSTLRPGWVPRHVEEAEEGTL